ncbi:alpha/beta hydrolase [Halomarina litorea]|uniref:alpha/beta hydrolase n=1 Tax=Halomarina litorea TaxID=2961595 RepID=UPI0020C4EF68|nr:alpha/beta hydrolase [Halomarina sp. BCD28]
MADDPHPQAQALLDTIDQSPMPPTYSLSTANARAVAEEFFAPTDPEPVDEVTEFSIPGPAGDVPLTVYHPEGDGPHPALVYLHGGGWTLGSRDTHDGVCRALSNRADCVVVSVEYRLAPEHPFPAGLEDCYAAVRWVCAHGDRFGVDTDRVAVGGDSAGGNLTAAITLMARDDREAARLSERRDGPRDAPESAPDIAHQVLIYPAVASPMIQRFDSYEENGEGYLLEWESMVNYYGNYLPNPAQRRNEYAAPLLARDLSGLPPATVITAGFDPLRDEGRAYADRLEEAGVTVSRHHYEGMIHAFVNFAEAMDAAGEAFDAIGDDLKKSF